MVCRTTRNYCQLLLRRNSEFFRKCFLKCTKRPNRESGNSQMLWSLLLWVTIRAQNRENCFDLQAGFFQIFLNRSMEIRNDRGPYESVMHQKQRFTFLIAILQNIFQVRAPRTQIQNSLNWIKSLIEVTKMDAGKIIFIFLPKLQKYKMIAC